MAKKEENKEMVVAQRIENAVKDLKNKDFNMFFFIVDSKNVPNGNMSYIYRMAKALQDKGYKVTMLYQLDDEYSPGELAEIEQKGMIPDDMKRFVGVGEWLGEEYASLPHMNIRKEEWKETGSSMCEVPETEDKISLIIRVSLRPSYQCPRRAPREQGFHVRRY